MLTPLNTALAVGDAELSSNFSRPGPTTICHFRRPGRPQEDAGRYSPAKMLNHGASFDVPYDELTGRSKPLVDGLPIQMTSALASVVLILHEIGAL